MQLIDLPEFSGGRSAFDVLGVSPDSDYDTMRREHRKLIAANHPDKVASNGGGADEVAAATSRAAEINFAWQILSDDETRESYVRLLSNPAGGDTDGGVADVDLDDGFFTADTPAWDEGADVIDDPTYDTPAATPAGVDARWADADVIEDTDDAFDAGDVAGPQMAGSPRLVSNLNGTWITAAIIAVCAIPAWLVKLPKPAPAPATNWALVVFVGLLVAATILSGLSGRRARNRSMPWKILQPGHAYGNLPPDPQAGRLSPIVARILGRVPSAIVVINEDPESPFSHAVVAGNKVAYLRGMAVPPGTYHWQNTSLVAEGPYVAVNEHPVLWRTQERTTASYRNLRGSQWTVMFPTDFGLVHANPLEGPAIVSPDQVELEVASWLLGQKHPERLSHQVAADTVASLYQWDTPRGAANRR